MVPTMTHRTVGQLVAERPRRAAIFEQLGIDYCCRGNRPLDEVCEERGIDPQRVLESLDADEAQRAELNEMDWQTAPLADLADHIQRQHHAYLRNELPRLDALLERVIEAHGQRHPELKLLRRVFRSLVNGLIPHMIKEECVVFPAIRRCERGDGRSAAAMAELRRAIRLMQGEHDDVGVKLSDMRDVCDDYQVPTDACRSWRALIAGLAALEADVHVHVHKENNILFPRAIEMLKLPRARIASLSAGVSTPSPSMSPVSVVRAFLAGLPKES